MQPVFKYNPSTSCLVEQPTMEKPVYSSIRDEYPEYVERYKEYKKHLASLQSIPTDFKEWGEGELVERIDFEVIKAIRPPFNESDMYLEAVPLLLPEPEEVQDLLWRDILDKETNFYGSPFISIADLKVILNNYSIKRK